jgi:hypothetical protein
MAQQIAVEWFHIEFQKRFPKETTEMYNNNQLGYEDLIQKAKEMGKRQIETAYNKGTIHGIEYPTDKFPLTGEQYYTQTYNKSE